MKHPCEKCLYRAECFEPCDKLLEYMELGPDPDMYDNDGYEDEDLPVLQQMCPRC